MLIALNGDEDYKGGELMYVNNYEPYHVPRTVGNAIVNHPGDVHGVVPHDGIRYSLLFLTVDVDANCIFAGVPGFGKHLIDM